MREIRSSFLVFRSMCPGSRALRLSLTLVIRVVLIRLDSSRECLVYGFLM